MSITSYDLTPGSGPRLNTEHLEKEAKALLEQIGRTAVLQFDGGTYVESTPIDLTGRNVNFEYRRPVVSVELTVKFKGYLEMPLPKREI